jgi:hypothetical protein
MRRHLALAATIAALALAACSDEPRSTPTEPGPDFDKGVPCPTTVFPLQGPNGANAQITALYPSGTLRTNALAKAADIAKKWSQCKVADPQQKVVAFINQLLLDFRANRLIGGQTSEVALKVSTLINTMLAGVNLAPNFPTTPSSDLDFGAGWFTPGTPLLVRASEGDGGVFLPANAFTVPTAITILRLPPSSNPFDDESVLPPFFDITASNSLGTHYLTSGTKAIVGFCVDEDVLSSLNQPAIAHIAATETGHPGGFELLDAATAAQYNSLGLTNCAQLPTSIGSLLHGGWPDLKSYASATLQSLLLPDALAAAVVAKGGLGGLASSLSPFGIADRSPDVDVGTLQLLDPQYSSETVGTSVTRRVQLVSGESPVSGQEVTFTVSDGMLGNEATEQTVTTDEDGQASVSWTISEAFPLASTLTATVPGSTVTYTVAGADLEGQLSALSCSLEGTIASQNSLSPVDVTFSNELFESPVSVYWLNFSGQREFPVSQGGGGIGFPYNTLSAGTSYVQPTYVTHPWLLAIPGEPEQCLGIFMPLSGESGGTAVVSESF